MNRCPQHKGHAILSLSSFIFVTSERDPYENHTGEHMQLTSPIYTDVEKPCFCIVWLSQQPDAPLFLAYLPNAGYTT